MMAKATLFNSNTIVAHNDRMLVALLIAFVVHMIIVLGVRFAEPDAPIHNSRSIDVVLVDTPVKKAPKKAQFLAPENQVGTGRNHSAKPQPAAKRVINEGNNQKRQTHLIEQEEETPKAKQRLITKPKAIPKIAVEKKKETTLDKEKRPQLTAEMLQQQIAQYGTEIRLKQESSDQTKIKSVNSVSTHKYAAAQYENDWERKVERVGLLNYPEYLAKNNLSASVTMSVWIRADGSIYNMRIVKSSGYPAVDEAAKRIVKISAPFPPLPSDLLKELSILEVKKTWKFMDKSGISTP